MSAEAPERSDTIPYFAYGTPVDPEMMTAIIGREPEGELAILEDHEIAIQRSHEISGQIKDILAKKWTAEEIADFESYALRKKVGGFVVGVVWEITPAERTMIDNWELTDDELWYKKTDVQVHTQSRGEITATTEILDDPSFIPAEELHPDMPAYLMPKDRIIEVANVVRAEHIARNQQ